MTIQENRKISDSIARAIVTRATEQGLESGSVLETEAEMMVRYGVSRGSLREALRILESLGFVQMKPGPKGGPILREPDSRQFSAISALFFQRIGGSYGDLLEMRLVLEPEAASLAALRRTDDHIITLKEYLDRANNTDLAQDKQFRLVGQGFHDMVAEMAGNPILSLVIHSCYDLFAGRTTGFLYPEEERQSVVDIHDEIAHAIIDGDSDAARRLMMVHMSDYLMQAGTRYPAMIREPVRW